MWRMILRCGLCRRVQDQAGQSTEPTGWMDLQAYLLARRLEPRDVVYTESYCQECTLAYHRLTTYGRTTEPPAPY